jgi:hypothetical protein
MEWLWFAVMAVAIGSLFEYFAKQSIQNVTQADKLSSRQWVLQHPLAGGVLVGLIASAFGIVTLILYTTIAGVSVSASTFVSISSFLGGLVFVVVVIAGVGRRRK